MECFINKDGETLKSFFREYIMENYLNIYTQINEALYRDYVLTKAMFDIKPCYIKHLYELLQA